MNRSGIDHHWLIRVPWEAEKPFGPDAYGPETPEMTELRKYTAREYVDGAWRFVHPDPPAAEVVWSHAQWSICGAWATKQRTDHANIGINNTPCELALDWVLFAFEHLVRNADSQPVEARARTMWHAWNLAKVAYRPEVPEGTNPLRGFSGVETSRLKSLVHEMADEWELLDWHLGERTAAAVGRHWDAEVAAGRKPWEQSP